MKPDNLQTDSTTMGNLLVPYSPAPCQPPKPNLAKKLEYIFANRRFPPVPDQAEKLAVFGSRSLYGRRVIEVIEKHASKFNICLVITAAEPGGVCRTAQEYAKSKCLPLQVHFLNKDKYARGAFEHRSDHVIQASDLVLLIHDGKSQGTYNEVLRTIKFKKPFIYEILALNKERNLLYI